jgi:hypothetical protein
VAKHEEFLKQVKERADAATPGPWQVSGTYKASIIADGKFVGSTLGVDGGTGRDERERNTAFIAAANPQTVLNLLAIIEKLKGELEFTEHLLSNGDGQLMALWKEDTDQELDEIVGRE